MANNQQSGSGFTNIQNILNANQNNKLGQAVGGGVMNAANNANNNLKNTENTFQSQVNQNLQGFKQAGQNVQNVLQDPTQATDQDVQNFAQYRSGQYNGPKDLGDTTNLQNQARTAEQLGQAGQTSGGRIGLLQQFAGTGPGYTSGQQKVDSLLLGQNANNNLAQARRVTYGLENKVNNAQSNAQQVGQDLQGRAQNLATNTNQAIQGVQNPLLSNLTSTAQQDQANKDASYQRIQQGLQSGTLSAADAQTLGLQAGTNIGNIDLTQFLSQNPTTANAQNVASADQIAKMNALARLSGTSQFADPSQANSFNQNQFSFNTAGLNSDIANQQAAYHQGADPIQSKLTNDQNSVQGMLNTLITSYKNSEMPTASVDENGNPITNAAASPAALAQTNLGKIMSDTGINMIDNPNAASQLANWYAQNQGSGSNYGKNFREDDLAGAGSDYTNALVAALNDFQTQNTALTGLQNQFGFGKTLQVT